MHTANPTRRHVKAVIDKLPQELLPEVADFLAYLQFKSSYERQGDTAASGDSFLMAIAGLGDFDESLSERDEDILSNEMDSLRGWGLGHDSPP